MSCGELHMNFNVDRIAVLAGLAGAGKSGLMKEGVAPVAATPAAQPAAPPAPAKVAPAKVAPVKAAPVKAAPKMEEVYEEDMYGEGMHGEGMYEEGMYEEEPVDEMSAETGGMNYDDMVYEVDETELMEALVDMREKRLEESKVRSAVRKELSSILNTKESGSRWLYGNRQPTSSSNGNVSRGFLGPGFR